MYKPAPIWRAILTTLRESAARQRARRELLAMDDHLLRDLGITREQIEDYIAGRLRQPSLERPALRLAVSNAESCCPSMAAPCPPMAACRMEGCCAA